MRVLIAAFACRPGAGSEPGAGFEVARGAAMAGCDVTLITQKRNKNALERAITDDLRARLFPVYIGLSEAVMERWDRLFRLRGLQVYYLLWQRPLKKTAIQLHRADPFAVAHHITMSADWAPSGLAGIPNLPLVWGPLGGSERIPHSVWRWLGWSGRLREISRRICLPLVSTLFGAKKSLAQARLVIAQNPCEQRALQTRTNAPVIVRPNVFLDAVAPLDSNEGDGAREESFVAIFAARLLAWKGGLALLEAMRDPRLRTWSLHIYGKGPAKRHLDRYVARYGLSTRVRFCGVIERAELRKRFENASVFVYPSFREPAGWVVGEALQVGCPVITVDIGGPPLLLGESGKVVPLSPTLPTTIATAMIGLDLAQRVVVKWERDGIGALLLTWYGRARSE